MGRALWRLSTFYTPPLRHLDDVFMPSACRLSERPTGVRVCMTSYDRMTVKLVVFTRCCRPTSWPILSFIARFKRTLMRIYIMMTNGDIDNGENDR